MKRRYLFFGNHLYILPILRPLQQAIRARGDEVAWYVSRSLAPELAADERCLTSVKEVMAYQADATFVPANTVPDFFPGLKVEVFHGFHVRKRSNAKGHYRLRGFFDLYCTQGPDTSVEFHRLAEQNGYFEVVETGWPKMDPLFTDPVERTEGQRPIILLTSTFTPSISGAKALFEQVKRLSASGEWQWLVQFHPKMDAEVVNAYRGIQGEHLRYVDTADTIGLLKQADVMVSDTSSIVSEFLLQNRPVVTLNNRAPGPQLLDIQVPEQLEGAIRQGLNPSDELLTAIREYGDLIHPYRDGRSSERVLDATESLLKRGRGHLKRKPLNLFRRLQVRKAMKYYRW